MENKLIEDLKLLPEAIMKKEIEIYQTLDELDSFKKRIDFLENIYTLKIINEKDDIGKPKYPNDISRQAEIKRRIELDKEISELDIISKDKQKILSGKKIELNYLLNKQSNFRAITKLYNRE